MATVLVIEDDPSILENILELLEMEGYQAIGAVDGYEGVMQAQQTIPDIIICDVLMPRLDGYGVLQTLRSLPSTAAIPLVFVSATPQEEILAASVRLGAADYLIKPFRATDLFRVISGVLKT